jgi:hypothetical protein
MAGVLVVPVLAQDWRGRARVDGRAEEADGTPVGGATVTARRIAGEGGPRVRSDGEGRFVVDGIASGSWVVEVAASGFRARRVGVHLPSDSSWLGPVVVQLEKLETEATGPVGYEHVRAAMEAGRVDRARRLLARIEADAGEDADTLFEIGRGFLDAGETGEAVLLLGKALDADPSHAEAHYRRALGLLALGRHAEAREDLEAVLELGPDGTLAEKAARGLDRLTSVPTEEQ